MFNLVLLPKTPDNLFFHIIVTNNTYVLPISYPCMLLKMEILSSSLCGEHQSRVLLGRLKPFWIFADSFLTGPNTQNDKTGLAPPVIASHLIFMI